MLRWKSSYSPMANGPTNHSTAIISTGVRIPTGQPTRIRDHNFCGCNFFALIFLLQYVNAVRISFYALDSVFSLQLARSIFNFFLPPPLLDPPWSSYINLKGWKMLLKGVLETILTYYWIYDPKIKDPLLKSCRLESIFWGKLKDNHVVVYPPRKPILACGPPWPIWNSGRLF